MNLRSAVSCLMVGCVLSGVSLAASNVEVRYKEGITHGFLILSTLDGTPIAEGDLTQAAHGNEVKTQVVYHFKDGSLQDETTVFSQRTRFALVSYHLIQKGPAFKTPVEMRIATSTGQVTVRYTDDKGQERVENQRMKLPPDLANGLIVTLMKNLRPGDPLPEFSMVVATPKPRIVKLALSLDGKETFSLAGDNREAVIYAIKIEIGGVSGLLAPLLDKQPQDSHVWMIGGEAPTFVKSEVLSYMGGPMWRTELLSPVWPKSSAANTGTR